MDTNNFSTGWAYPSWWIEALRRSTEIYEQRKNKVPTPKKVVTTKVVADKTTSCAYCEVELIIGLDATKDHIIPLSKGGSNKVINKVWCCKGCNNKKGDLSLAKWLFVVDQKLKGRSPTVMHRNYYKRVKRNLKTKWIPFVEQNQQKMVKHLVKFQATSDANDNFY